MKTLYYSCPAGICGDMHLGAMVDLGVDPDELLAELGKLELSGWSISFTRDQRKGISGTRCDVFIKEETPQPLSPLIGHHGHVHRTFRDIREMIEKSSLAEAVKSDSINIFRALAEAEGLVHGKPADSVHFHEVGAVDSILDIVGGAICWDLLGVSRISASAVELGGGTVQCAHGRMPVPAPATARLVEGFPVTIGGTSKEATTPTGAALLAGKGCLFNQPASGKALATGIGIGQRDNPELANVLYVTLLDQSEGKGQQETDVVELVTNLDDMNPERIAFLAEILLEEGALDVWQTPAAFKKGRLGCVFSVLAAPEDRDRMTSLLIKHSTTLGIRWRVWNRSVLDRETSEKESSIGTVHIKSALHEGQVLRSKIEFDDLSRLAREHNLSLSETEDKVSK